MPTYAITGATGQFGRLVVEALLARGVAANAIVALARTPAKAADLAVRGVQVRAGDYDQPESWPAALAGVDRLLLVSSSEVGQRVTQHGAVIGAAVTAGVGHLAYTSVLHADSNTLGLAPEHRATEQLIGRSPLPFTLLRNGWYTENFTTTITQALASGSFIGSAGTGRVASAARADYAAAAAAVLVGRGHQGQVYELSGDVAWSYPELAAELTRVTGQAVTYHDLGPAEHHDALLRADLPHDLVDALVSYDRATAAGELADTPGELRALLGRPTTPLAATVTAIHQT